jgi:predicted molibdopterin-dependent oxidoreductase YjgC
VKQQIRLTVNGKPYEFKVYPCTTLLEVLRDNLKLTRTREGCIEADGKEIITSEALPKEAEFYPIQETFVDQAAIKCAIPGGSLSRQEFPSFCHICAGHCSIKVIVEDGRVIDIVPDMESGFPNELCPIKKGRLSIPEILIHPGRLKYPQKRIGARGEGKWQRISWDEALDTIAEKLSDLPVPLEPQM